MANLKWRKERAGEYRSLCGRFELYTLRKTMAWFLYDTWTGTTAKVASPEAGKVLAENVNNDMTAWPNVVPLQIVIPPEPECN